MKLVAWIILIVALVALGPILTIWAMNVLFPVLAIPYTLETWFAVVVLAATLRSSVKVQK